MIEGDDAYNTSNFDIDKNLQEKKTTWNNYWCRETDIN